MVSVLKPHNNRQARSYTLITVITIVAVGIGLLVTSLYTLMRPVEIGCYDTVDEVGNTLALNHVGKILKTERVDNGGYNDCHTPTLAVTIQGAAAYNTLKASVKKLGLVNNNDGDLATLASDPKLSIGLSHDAHSTFMQIEEDDPPMKCAYRFVVFTCVRS